jgi:hypothetical protein
VAANCCHNATGAEDVEGDRADAPVAAPCWRLPGGLAGRGDDGEFMIDSVAYKVRAALKPNTQASRLAGNCVMAAL